MRTRGLKVAAAIGVVAAASWTPRVHAQSSKVAAEALFEEGRKLIEQDDPARACPKFADSQRLDPSPSTLLNLGSCYEKLGKTASAWATYRGAASAAHALGRQGLVDVAQRHAAAIEPDLARVAITPSAPAPEIEITRNGQLVGPGEWDVAVPVDPGVVAVEASAPNKKKWSTTIEVTQRGKTVKLAVPALEDAPPEPTTTTTSAQMTGPAYDTATLTPGQVAWQKPTALVAGGLGVAGLVVGTVFVLNAKSKYDDSLELCPSDSNVCSPQGVSLRDEARSAGNIATVAYAIGAVSLAAGAVIWLTAPKPKKAVRAPTTAELHVSPSVGGLTMYGRW